MGSSLLSFFIVFKIYFLDLVEDLVKSCWDNFFVLLLVNSNYFFSKYQLPFFFSEWQSHLLFLSIQQIPFIVFE